ncbi:cytochrome P450 [Streptomyces sp. NRRL F-5630]|uniref:cytochrome P450 n=1 Tax=Streptomyces sp. NRRL F-5630 TaxID=1463864 RepID=UPI003D73645E
MTTSVPPEGAVPPPGCPAHAPAGSATPAARARPRPDYSGVPAPEGRDPATEVDNPNIGPGRARRLNGPDAERDQQGLYDTLRLEYGEVAPVLLPRDVPAWLVLGHEENRFVCAHPELFTTDGREWRLLQDGTVGPDHPMAPIFMWQPVCAFVEGEEHERLREPLEENLRVTDLRELRRLVQRGTYALLNDLCEEGFCDLTEDYCERLPMIVLLGLFGMSHLYDDRFLEAARDLIKGTETANASNEHLMKLFRAEVERARVEPGDDFASQLLAHRAGMSAREVSEHLRIVLIAAYETTANLLANAMRILLVQMEVRGRVGAGRLNIYEAIEQALWDEPPFSAMLGRYALRDVEVGGRLIRKGDAVMLGYAAGNVDTRVRPALEAPVRDNRSHLAFGRGPHACPGQYLGRQLCQLALDDLLAWLPDMRLAVPSSQLRWSGSLLSRHLVELPVRFEPRSQRDEESIGTFGLPLPKGVGLFPPPDEEHDLMPVEIPERILEAEREAGEWRAARMRREDAARAGQDGPAPAEAAAGGAGAEAGGPFPGPRRPLRAWLRR